MQSMGRSQWSRWSQWSFIGGLAVAVVAAFGAPSYGQSAASGAQAELKTATTHAGFAAKYDSLKEVTLHLHHVVNCLVGSKDTMFDAAAGNPCQGQGDGFLPDTKAASGESAQYHEAWWVAHMATQAIEMKSLDQAKAAAHIATVVLPDVASAK